MNRCMRIFVNMPLLSLTSTVVAHQNPSITIDGQSLSAAATASGSRWDGRNLLSGIEKLFAGSRKAIVIS